MRQTRPRAQRPDWAGGRPVRSWPGRRPTCIRPARPEPEHRPGLLLLVLVVGSALGAALGAISDALQWPPVLANGFALAIVVALTAVTVRYVVPPDRVR